MKEKIMLWILGLSLLLAALATTANQCIQIIKPVVLPSHSPCPPYPNCKCGCTITGSCVCKDCDHPKID